MCWCLSFVEHKSSCAKRLVPAAHIA